MSTLLRTSHRLHGYHGFTFPGIFFDSQPNTAITYKLCTAGIRAFMPDIGSHLYLPQYKQANLIYSQPHTVQDPLLSPNIDHKLCQICHTGHPLGLATAMVMLNSQAFEAIDDC